MNSQEQQQAFQRYVDDMSKTLISKGDDYSNADRLSNFKTSAAILGISPEMHCLALIATKVSRLGNLVSSGKKPNNESLDDNVKDLAVYSLLLRMIIEEERIKTRTAEAVDSSNLIESTRLA